MLKNGAFLALGTAGVLAAAAVMARRGSRSSGHLTVVPYYMTPEHIVAAGQKLPHFGERGQGVQVYRYGDNFVVALEVFGKNPSYHAILLSGDDGEYHVDDEVLVEGLDAVMDTFGDAWDEVPLIEKVDTMLGMMD